MINLILLGSLIALGIGAVTWAALHLVQNKIRVAWWEWAAVAGVLLVIIVPLTMWVGYNMSVNSQTTYHEFLGGVEVSVSQQTFHCYESSSQGGDTGGCVNTFDADPYTVMVAYQVCTTSGTGSHQHTSCTTHYRPETRWRQVPYTQTETSWVIHTTLGDFTVGDHWLEANPNAHRIRAMDGSEDGIPGNLHSGTPQLWSQAQARIAAGDPGPVTVPHDYSNYILASQQTILHTYSNSISSYEKQGLLPSIGHDVYNTYYVNKAYFVGGVSVGDQAAWQYRVQKLDAALGSTEQGDMYVVVVNANKVQDPNDYSMALTAYWESPAFDKWDISKNGIIVVLGTKDGKTVAWARATTGMPQGNEQMMLDVQNKLAGTQLTPDAVLGNPTMSVSQNTKGKFVVTVHHTNGALENILWGPDHFVRVQMTTGYSYLKGEIQPTGTQEFWMLFIVAGFSVLAWGAILFFGAPALRNYQSGRSGTLY